MSAMPFVSVVVSTVSRLCFEPPSAPTMFVLSGCESRTRGVKLILTAKSVTHTKSGIFPLRTDLYVQTSPTRLEIEVHQLKIRVPAGDLLFLRGAGCHIPVRPRIIGCYVDVQPFSLSVREGRGEACCNLRMCQTVHACRQFENSLRAYTSV